MQTGTSLHAFRGRQTQRQRDYATDGANLARFPARLALQAEPNNPLRRLEEDPTGVQEQSLLRLTAIQQRVQDLASPDGGVRE
jgi:hypothetical protein